MMTLAADVRYDPKGKLFFKRPLSPSPQVKMIHKQSEMSLNTCPFIWRNDFPDSPIRSKAMRL